jgi:polar amino acid transport system substrate-binding protein
LALTALVLSAAGCGSSSTPPTAVTVAPIEAQPAGAQQVTTLPAAGNADCDREASLRPGPQPRPGAMPPGSTMAAIAERGRLVVGVDQNTFLFGFRNPSSGQLEGFDIDVAREIARSIFGDPDRVDLRVVDASQRESALESGQVDLVVRTFSITCDRKDKVAFSTTYFNANQRILVVKGSGIASAADLSGKRVCAVRGTTSLSALFALDPRPTLFGVSSWTDCLVMLQQGQVDAVSTDDVVLFGLAAQDPNTDVVGPSMGIEPYGVGIKKENTDLVRFVNGVLDEMRADGTWQRLYDARLRSLGPSPEPPSARYQD